MNSLQGLVAARVAELNITKQSLADAVGVSLVTFNKKYAASLTSPSQRHESSQRLSR